MEIGLFGFFSDLDNAKAELRRASEAGYGSYWVPQAFGPDSLTAIAVAGQDLPNLRIGTAVIPTYPRHPQMLAQQALTTNAAIGGRLIVGIGPSHQVVVEGQWGISFDKPIRHMREYLEILMPLLETQKASVRGETLSCVAEISVPGAPVPKVMVAALGPQLLGVTGRLCDGTITWMTGPNTIRDLTVPVLNAAAEKAGRPAPEVVAGFPICVTDAVDAARERAAKSFAIYGKLPSYRAMLDREGYDGPADLALVGSEEQVLERIEAIGAVGVTTFAASVFGSREERARTNELLGTLLK
ncbi:MAG: TIGR03564 family F420-dependent LLM class oxidoreductase [Acidimicrobiales bacterium]